MESQNERETPLKGWIKKQKELIEIEHHSEQEEHLQMIKKAHVQDLRDMGFLKSKLQIKKVTMTAAGKALITFVHKNYPKLKQGEQKYLQKINFVEGSRPCQLAEGDIVGLYFFDRKCQFFDSKPLLYGVLSLLAPYKICVQFMSYHLEPETGFASALDEAFQKKLFCLVQMPTEITFNRQAEILRSLESTKFESHLHATLSLLFGIQPMVSGHPFLQSHKETYESLEKLEIEDKTLNLEQTKAVEMSLREQVIALIHGPPGTGKTKTVCEVIRQLAKRNKKVLVAAPSNVAVDNIAERICSKGLRIVRLGQPARVDPRLLNLTLDAQVREALEKDPDTRKLEREHHKVSQEVVGAGKGKQQAAIRAHLRRINEEIKTKREVAWRSILHDAQIVLSTCSSAGDDRLKSTLGEKLFDVTVIDECAQSLEVECWIPLSLGKRGVLAGDHKQLPPTVKSKEAEKKGLSVTLFDRLFKLIEEQNCEAQFSVMLQTQYRMNKKIMEIASQTMYDGKLRADKSVADHSLKLRNLEPEDKMKGGDQIVACLSNESVLLIPDDSALFMIDTDQCGVGDNTTEISEQKNKIMSNYESKVLDEEGVKEKTLGSKGKKKRERVRLAPVFSASKKNFGEALLTGLIYYTLRTVYRLKNSEIGIITPYSAQVELIKSHIENSEVQRAISKKLGEEPLRENPFDAVTKGNNESSKVEVATVDGFQGREKEAIVISMVRSNPERELGFLKERRRMNVAITRARKLLVLIGDSGTASEDPFLKEVVDAFKRENAVISARDLVLDKSLLDQLEEVHLGIDWESQVFQSGAYINADKGQKKGKKDDREIGEKTGEPKKKKKNKKKKTKNGNNDIKEESKEQGAKPSSLLDEPDPMEESKKRFRLQVEMFSKDESANCLEFDPSLTGLDRRILHGIAEEFGLSSYSKGEGAQRHIIIAKKKEIFVQEDLIGKESEEDEIQNEKVIKEEAKNEENTTKKEEVLKKKKKKKAKRKAQVEDQTAKMTEEEFVEQLRIENEQKESNCSFLVPSTGQPCARDIRVMGINCRFCGVRHCPEHAPALKHGCEDAFFAEQEERKQLMEEYRNGTKLQQWKEQELRNKLQSKLSQQVKERAKKDSGKGKKKK